MQNIVMAEVRIGVHNSRYRDRFSPLFQTLCSAPPAKRCQMLVVSGQLKIPSGKGDLSCPKASIASSYPTCSPLALAQRACWEPKEHFRDATGVY